MFNRNIIFWAVSSLVVGSFFYGYNRLISNNKSQNTLAKTHYSSNGQKGEKNEEKMERVRIFGDGEDISNEFNALLLNKDSFKYYNEDEIREHLGGFIRKRILSLKDYSFPNQFQGKIYYKLNKFSVEIYVVWKHTSLSRDFDYYDRFEILLTTG